MCKKNVQHQRRHRKQPSKWRHVYVAIVILFRIWDWIARHWE